MKIAVYAIALNEEKFVSRWYKSCVDADVVVLGDTGSTDNTRDMFDEVSKYSKQHIINDVVTIIPWRFDDARNAVLAMVPRDVDICICLDLDEVLVPGWREIVEKHFDSTRYDRLRYNYVWSWNNGKPGVTYHADKIHTRSGFRWVGPVHETLHKDARMPPEVQMYISETLIHHFPDETKSRSSYLSLLELAVKEDPTNDRNAHYYARDLLFANRLVEAIDEFKRHLALPKAKWKPERAASYRYMGDALWGLGKYHAALQEFENAVYEAPDTREPYIAAAQAYRYLENWKKVIEYCDKALKITERPSTYINWPTAWGDWPMQMMQEAISKLESKI